MPSWNSGSLGSGRVTSIRGDRRDIPTGTSERKVASPVHLGCFVASDTTVPPTDLTASTGAHVVNEDQTALAPPAP